jgi:hypothetical protein
MASLGNSAGRTARGSPAVSARACEGGARRPVRRDTDPDYFVPVTGLGRFLYFSYSCV